MSASPRDYGALAARLLQPAQPRLREAARLARVDDADSPALLESLPRGYRSRDAAAVWESFAVHGLIPFAWLHGEARAFWDHWREEPSSAPADLKTALTFASDAEQILLVEALAREVVARVAPWGVRTNAPRILWRAGDDPEVLWRKFSSARYALWGISAVLPASDAPLSPRLQRSYQSPAEETQRLLYLSKERWRSAASVAHQDALAELRWEKALQRDHVLRPELVRSAQLPEALMWKRLAELPNPIPPLLDIWAQGYALVEIQRDWILLATS